MNDYRYKDILVNVERHAWNRRYSLYITHRYPDGKYADLTDCVFTERENEVVPTESEGIVLSDEAAHQLMDRLWISGVRPSNNLSPFGEPGALTDHIQTLKEQNKYLQSIINELLKENE